MAEETQIVIPDYIEPIVGWRAWFSFTELIAPYRSRLNSLCHAEVVWTPGETVVAVCPNQSILKEELRHDVPSAACSCGLYALKTLDQVVSLLDAGYYFTAIGRVELFGRVLICENGYRAERARIKPPLYEFKQGKEGYVLGLEHETIKVAMDAEAYRLNPNANVLLDSINSVKREEP